jgi:hypothetical protein
MLEFIFNKEEMKDLIAGSDAGQDQVIVRLSFAPGKDKVFPARVTARCQKGDEQAVAGREIGGCPNPPGCG